MAKTGCLALTVAQLTLRPRIALSFPMASLESVPSPQPRTVSLPSLVLTYDMIPAIPFDQSDSCNVPALPTGLTWDYVRMCGNWIPALRCTPSPL